MDSSDGHSEGEEAWVCDKLADRRSNAASMEGAGTYQAVFIPSSAD